MLQQRVIVRVRAVDTGVASESARCFAAMLSARVILTMKVVSSS